MIFYQILRIYLILLKDLNNPSLLYWAIPMQDLNHGGQITQHHLKVLTSIHSQQRMGYINQYQIQLIFCQSIFTDQPNLAVHYSAHPSMHLIAIIKLFIVSFMIEYPPPYECLVWEYRCSHQNAIAQTLDQID